MSFAQRPKLGLETLDERIVPAVIDLTTAGTNGAVAGAIVHHMDGQWAPANGGAQSHGTGALTTVLAVNHNNNEAGYNTTASPLQAGMDTTVAQALNLSQIPIVTVNGNQYYELVLNVNETGGKNARNISVDALQLFFSNVSTLKNYSAATKTLGAGANKVSAVYDLDAVGDNSLLVRAKVNTAATGEVAVLVPVSNFAGANANSFVYIYTKISGASGGDEQWGVRQAPPVAPPTGSASLSGTVTFDANQSPEDDDPKLAGVTIKLLDSDGTTLMTTTTDGNGFYQFSNLAAGTYAILADFSTYTFNPSLTDTHGYGGSGTQDAGYETTFDVESDGMGGIGGIVVDGDDVGLGFNISAYHPGD